MRKQLDSRIPTLIANNVQQNHRSFIVLVGDKGRDQIVNLHFLLSQARVSARPSVLWCYKKDLGFTTHRKKAEAKIKRDVKRGIREPNERNPFEIFVTVTDIRYSYYKESHKILGSTVGMLVLQDFEALTPNLLARTIETVEGGGVVVLLLKTMSSLRQLYTMSMDVHARYKTSQHESVTPRFNERFILSLGACPDCLFLDDELNVLPISRGKDILPSNLELNQKTVELDELKLTLKGTAPAETLVSLSKTIDQGKAVLTFIDAISEKTLSSTVTLTAGRGRGKSAALGLSMAAAISYGYSNIFVTSPSPENLKTLFEFVFKGLDGLGYEEHLDYDIQQSTNPDLNKAIVRVNVFKGHRQTIQYIHPTDAHVLGQAELVIIDEAAAIPLPLVRSLMGPYLVFMASTINGYEGTGRSLSLKLIQQLRESQNTSSAPVVESSAQTQSTIKTTPKARTLREISLDTPIRYSAGDTVEKWLHTVLCLDATVSPVPRGVTTSTGNAFTGGLPHPSLCTLYHVSRRTLFSFHPASEVFLHRMMALYVASHYRNQPNDLQLMSDAPGHELFVLLPPLSDNQDEGPNFLPQPLVVLQVAMEGALSKDAVMESLTRGQRAGGDMIPWLVSQQFQEDRFAALSGVRIVRVAAHPEVSNMGYGSRAIKALNEYFSGEIFSLDEHEKASRTRDAEDDMIEDDGGEQGLLSENAPKVRSADRMPPLLQRLEERRPEAVDWIGVSYGLTGPLLRFWKRLNFIPLYLRQTTNDLTGEHTCVMIRGLNSSTKEDVRWLGEFAVDFRSRLTTLLSFPRFRDFGSATALSILDAVNSWEGLSDVETSKSRAISHGNLAMVLTPFDIKRLEAYGNNMLDYHVIADLLPVVAGQVFERRLVNTDGENLHLSAVQSAILMGVGLQRKSVEDVESELSLPVSQILAMLVKVLRKVTKRLLEIQREGIEGSMRAKAQPQPSEVETPSLKTLAINDSAGAHDLAAELATNAANDDTRMRQRELLSSLDLKKFAIDESAADWSSLGEGKAPSGVVSVKTLKRKVPASEGVESESARKKPTRRSGGKKSKSKR